MELQLATDGCAGSEHEVVYLEHVQVKVSLTYSRRGDLQLHLFSPAGTPSTLLPRRKDDYQPGKLDAWHFLSVFYWGERPNGTWTLILENVGSELNAGNVEESYSCIEAEFVGYSEWVSRPVTLGYYQTGCYLHQGGYAFVGAS